MKRKITSIQKYENIDNLIPGVRGQRAFPTRDFKNSDPFLMLDHIGPQVVGADYFLDGKGHAHPHRGFETITFMFEGHMDHVDSLGNKAKLDSGSVQRMNAGKGIIHGGNMAADKATARFHELQLWVNNPATEKMSEPEIQTVSKRDIPTISDGHMFLRVMSGVLNQVEGPLNTHADTRIGHLIAKGKGKMDINGFNSDDRLMVYVLEGDVFINEEPVRAFELAEFNQDGDHIEILTEGKAQLLILAGKPLNEPVAFGGPFVMNTQDEILQANMDFQQGLFGTVNEAR